MDRGATLHTDMRCIDGSILSPMSVDGSQLSDEALVERIKKPKDHAEYCKAWDALYTRWFPKMRDYCGRALGAAYANDVAQDVMFKCSRSIRGFRGRSSFKTWLYTVASSCVVDKGRELAKTVTTASDRDFAQVPNREAGVSPETAVEARELQECCRHILKGLPRETRTIIALHRDGLTFKQIGEQLSLSENAVTGRFYRAVERVGKSMLDYTQGGRQTR